MNTTGYGRQRLYDCKRGCGLDQDDAQQRQGDQRGHSIGVGAGAAVHLSNSVVSSNSVAGIAISGGGINIDATTSPSTRSASSKSADRSTCPTTTFLRYVGTRFDGLRKI
ncbi:hypothetical protein QA633_31760 [Bradyrhizobium barranii]|uniref:hypothetical protein n=1 Tax=Bradyrhizobium barranii TaxID=2992140 RepID=UPI0024AEC87E|nr:hypothetical protein [Bradyrhizobium barranii]WFT92876.1 hypothetical protein QA633_31760 [Bradyrhizobium barranii]